MPVMPSQAPAASVVIVSLTHRLAVASSIVSLHSAAKGDWKSVLHIQVGDTETWTDAQIQDAATLVRTQV